jgi:hypothetical protein
MWGLSVCSLRFIVRDDASKFHATPRPSMLRLEPERGEKPIAHEHLRVTDAIASPSVSA